MPYSFLYFTSPYISMPFSYKRIYKTNTCTIHITDTHRALYAHSWYQAVTFQCFTSKSSLVYLTRSPLLPIQRCATYTLMWAPLNDLSINLLKSTGHVMHQQFNIQQLYVLPTLYLCVLYLSENKQRLVPLTA